MIRTIRPALLLLLLAITIVPIYAQVQTGTPAFGSFTGGPDVINLANLNVHLNIPILHRAGRGTNFAYDLGYDSSVWMPVTSGSTKLWQPVSSTWGWQGSGLVGAPFISYSITTNGPQQCYDGSQWNSFQIWYYSNFVYQDAYGVQYQYNVGGAYTYNSGRCGPLQGATPASPWHGQVSDYTLNVNPGTGYVNAYIVDGSGTIISPTVTSNPAGQQGSYSSTDRNGNQITSSNGVFHDTLSSSTPVLTVAGAGTPASARTFTYTAPGGSASYKMVFSTYAVQTHFNCGSGFTDYGGANGISTALVSEIDLPDGSKYSFGYEATLGGASGAVTGRLASVTLPTGGTINYKYMGGDSSHNGITCADGSAAGLQRTTPDTGSNYWNYARTPGTGGAYTTTITDPSSSGNQTVIQFQGIYETQRQVYQGSTSGTLLTTTYTCYNGIAFPCNSTAVSRPFTQRNVNTQFGTSGLQGMHIYKYNSYELPYEEDDYDYKNGLPTAVLRKTYTAYASLSNGIVDMPSTVAICNSTGSDPACGNAGTPVAKTTFTYDQFTLGSSSNTPQHAAVSGSRGNATTIASMVSSGTTLSRSFTYFDTGMVQTSTDVNNAVTTYIYHDAISTCGNAFPTSVNEPLSLSRSMTWNCSGAVLTQVTDENGKNTTTSYTDAYFWRPNALTDAAGAVTTYSYPSSAPYNWVEANMPIISGKSVADVRTTVDGLGRPILQQTEQGPSASNYDTVETDYGWGSLGRTSKVTLPFNAAAGITNSSAPGTTTKYDALGRVSTVSDSGTGSTSYSYINNDALVEIDGQPSTENPKKRQLEFDGLGRLTSVCEVTQTSSGYSGGPCTQNNPLTGYLTLYTYDMLGDLKTVTQNAQTGGTSQSRSYNYDALGRMTSETNPEIGPSTGATPINYTYDISASPCTAANYSGDLVKKVDPQGTTTCFTYDALHRNTSITYSGGYATATPNKYFVYDAATINTSPTTQMLNAKARLAEAYTATSQNGTKITDQGFSYSPRGESADVYQLTPRSSPSYYHVSQTYWLHGAPNALSSNIGTLPTITYGGTIGSTSGLDGEGRVIQVTASSGVQNPVTNVNYNPYGIPAPQQTVTFGSGDSDVFTYDPNTFRMTKYQFNVGTNGLSDSGTLTWNANSTLQQLVIADALPNSKDSQTCTYGYDDLVRVTSASCGTAAGQSFTYDPFGNIAKSGSPSAFAANYYSTRNRINTVGSTTAQYDNNGNVLNDGVHTYAWDADGNSITVDTVGATFDALDRMVEQNRSSVYTEIVYSPTGAKLALMSGTTGQTLQNAFIPLPGQATAVYTSAGLDHYRHSDWLGSARATSSPTRTATSTTAYAPFGETYAQSGTTDASFTGQNMDTVSDPLSGDYDFLYREYNTQGRWSKPDPAGLGAANPMNPQSWNRYAYVLNNPLGFTDHLGLDCSYDEGGGVTWITRGDCISDTDDGVYTKCDGCLMNLPTTAQNPSDLEYWWAISTNVLPIYVPDDVPLSPSAQRYAVAIAKALPTVCGGGVFYYTGREVDTGVLNGFVGVINEYDTRTGSSGGLLFEGGTGEGMQGGGGVIVSGKGPGGSAKEGVGSTGLLYGGPGVKTPVASASGGLVGFTSGTGIYADGQLFTWGAGGGAYLNITTVGGCPP